MNGQRDLVAEARSLRRTGRQGLGPKDAPALSLGDLVHELYGSGRRCDCPPPLGFAVAALEGLAEELDVVSTTLHEADIDGPTLATFVWRMQVRADVAAELARRMGQHEAAAARVARVPSPPWTADAGDRRAFVAGRFDAFTAELRQGNPTADELARMAQECETLRARLEVMAADAAQQTGA